MRLRYTVHPPRAPDAAGVRAAPDAQTGEIDIPGSTVAKVVTSLGGVTGLVTLLGFWLIKYPDATHARELGEQTRAQNERCVKLAVLAPALLPADAQERANSLNLLLAAGVVDDPTGELAKLTKAPTSIPRWTAAPLTASCTPVPAPGAPGAAGPNATAARGASARPRDTVRTDSGTRPAGATGARPSGAG